MLTLKDYVNWGLTHCDKTASAEGVPLVMENCVKNKKMKQLEVYGNSVQNGTPSPENPIEVESVGEKCTKNLIDFQTARNRDGYTAGVLTFDDDSLTYVGNYYFVFDVALESGKTYVFSAEYQNESERNTAWYLVYSDGTQYGANFKKSITIPSEKTVVSIRIYTTTGTAGANVDTLTMRNIQLEEGSVATEYEPYGKYKVPVLVRGKNLFDCITSKALHIGSIKNIKRTSTGISYTANALSTHIHLDLGLASEYVGKTLTASFDIELMNDEMLGSTRFVVCNADGSDRVEVSKQGTTVGEHYCVTTTLGSDYGEKHLALRLYINNAVVGQDYEFKNIIVSESATDVPYEPYVEPITTNVYLNEPLRRIGDYADVLDFKNKKVIRNTLKRVYDGVYDSNNPYSIVDNETAWDIVSANDNFFLCTLSDSLPVIPKNGYADFNHKPLCVQLPTLARVNNSTAASAVAEEQIWYTGAGRNVRLFLSKSREGLGDGSTSAFRAYLQANPITVYCAVYEPYEEPIECELPILETKTSIVEVATSLLPSNIKGKYMKK